MCLEWLMMAIKVMVGVERVFHSREKKVCRCGKEEKKSVDRVPLPGMGFEPMCAYAHWILSPTP